MLRKTIAAALAAAVFAGSGIISVAPADAKSRTSLTLSFGSPDYMLQHRPSGPGECWRWSRRHQNWTWICPIQYHPVYRKHPMYVPYAYGPYNNPYIYDRNPGFNFSFGFSGH
jgi:hypothetical protein